MTMHKRPAIVASIPLLLLLLLMVAPTPCGAAVPLDPLLAFRTPAGEAPDAAGSADPPAGIASPLTPAALDRPPISFLYPPPVQIAQAAGTGSSAPAVEAEEKEPSLTEVNKQLTNPVSSFWSITMQFNNYYLANHQWNYNMNFQPVLPVSLTKDWNLITRPVATLYNSVPVPVQGDPNKAFNQTTAFGDTILLEMLSPAHSGPWLIGVGPTFIFPTATSLWTGQGRWQAGPGAVVGYLSKEFIVGLFPQWWWSIGSANRANTAQMNLQPFAAWFFGEGWSVGYSGNILADFLAPAKEVWTVPLGLSLGKVVKLGKLPVRFALAGQWMAVHPTNSQEWNIQVTIAPVIPKLIKGTLFE
jgi:hypothetical protein